MVKFFAILLSAVLSLYSFRVCAGELIDDEANKAEFVRVQKAYDDCGAIDLPDDTIQQTHIRMKALYDCYKNVAFQLIDSFQPAVAEDVKQDFQAYLEATDKMLYNKYRALIPCGGNCGNITEDYFVADRMVIIRDVVKDYISSVRGYIEM